MTALHRMSLPVSSVHLHLVRALGRRVPNGAPRTRGEEKHPNRRPARHEQLGAGGAAGSVPRAMLLT